MWKRITIPIVIIGLVIRSCYGEKLFRLTEIFNFKSPNMTGVSTVPGPNGTQAMAFTANVKGLDYKGNMFAYIAHMISNSKDFTFTTYFKITGKPTEQKKDWTFFALSAPIITENTYFGMGLEFVEDTNVIEGEEQGKKKLKQSFFIMQRTTLDRTTHRSSVVFKNPVKFDQWIQLTVRVKESKFSVRLNCEEVGTAILSQGQTEAFPYGGILSLAYYHGNVDIFDDKKYGPVGIFTGALSNPTLIDTAAAFDWYSPCDADFSKQDIPSEPVASEYNSDRFDNFLRMLSSGNKPVRIFCTDKNNVKHYSLTTWGTICYKYSCRDGKIEENYYCAYCTDNNKNYKDLETWIDHNDPCVKKECDGSSRAYGLTKTSAVVCPILNCNSYGSMGAKKPTNECCDKCWSDSCVEGKKYYEGCNRYCTDGINFTCKEKKRGCWCPEGYALNKNNQCIVTDKCRCKSGSTVYLPGQAVVASSCKTCICAHGTMICFRSCGL